MKWLMKYKYYILFNVGLILFIIFFPMYSNVSKHVSMNNRMGYIVEKNVVISQKFKSEHDNIERISLMLSTTDKSANCSVFFKLYDDNDKLIGEKVVRNEKLSLTLSATNNDTDYVNFYLDKRIENIKGKILAVEISTDCDDIIKAQLYNNSYDSSFDSTYVNGLETNKLLAIRYSGVKKAIHNILYPLVAFFLSIIFILGGKNEKK